MKLGIYIYIYIYHGTWAHLNGVLHKSLWSVFVSACVSLLSLLGNGSEIQHYRGNEDTCESRNIVGRVRELSKESRRLILLRNYFFPPICIYFSPKSRKRPMFGLPPPKLLLVTTNVMNPGHSSVNLAYTFYLTTLSNSQKGPFIESSDWIIVNKGLTWEEVVAAHY
jgi:hypothetical protein